MRSVFVVVRSARLPSGDLRLRSIGYAFESGIAVEAVTARVWAAESVLDVGMAAILSATRDEVVKLLQARLTESTSE